MVGKRDGTDESSDLLGRAGRPGGAQGGGGGIRGPKRLDGIYVGGKAKRPTMHLASRCSGQRRREASGIRAPLLGGTTGRGYCLGRENGTSPIIVHGLCSANLLGSRRKHQPINSIPAVDPSTSGEACDSVSGGRRVYPRELGYEYDRTPQTTSH